MKATQYCVTKQSELTQFKAVEVTEKRQSVLTAGKLGFVCLTGCLWTMDERDNTASEVMRGETLHLRYTGWVFLHLLHIKTF